MISAAILTRKSNDEFDKSVKSIEVQESVCRRFAEKSGWAVGPVFSDDGISGAIYEWPGLLNLLAAVESKDRAFDVVIVSALDRIGREMIETLTVLDKIEKAGARVFSADDGQEITGANDDSGMKELMRSFKMISARIERTKTITRVRNAARERFEKGYVVGGRVYGYDNVKLPGVKANSILRRNDAQASVVERIFKLRAEGMGLTRIARLLNSEGVPGPQRLSDAAIERLQREGKPVPINHWQAAGVREVLHREHYIGQLVFGKRVRTGPKKKAYAPESQWQRIERPELRIISDDLYAQAHSQIKRARDSFLRTSTGKLLGQVETAKGKALLSGFVICGSPALSPRLHGGSICGEPMIITARGRNNVPAYACRGVKSGKGKDYCGNTTAVPREELEMAVIASLNRTFSAESFKEHQRRVAEDQELKASRAAQRAHLTAELPRLRAKAARPAKMVADLDDAGALLAEYTAIQGQVKETKDQLAYLDKADSETAIQEADAGALEATWMDWLAQADKDPGVARQMLRKALATPIAVRPTGKGTWAFAGFGTLDKLVTGDVAHREVLVDSSTSARMIAYVEQALGGAFRPSQAACTMVGTK
jgi:site-specific DNA recombinase